MELIHSPSELRPGTRSVCLAIGFFDGVHLGHQQVIRQAVADAEQHEGVGAALTFDRHPKAIVAPDRVPPLIHSLPQRLRAISAVGVEAALLLEFNENFSRTTGEDFIRKLVKDVGRVASICVGSTFTFGYKRSGDVALLKRLGEELGFTVHGLAAVSLDGQPVSSTRIRNAIGQGQLDLASQMMGRSYSLAGTVVAGDRIGRELGFPTANLEVGGRVMPPAGVYAAHALARGVSHRSVVNIGYRPTLQQANPPLRVEAHLLDFKGELQGAELELVFVERLRDERRFPSRTELQEQIARDIVQARRMFGQS